MTEGWFFAIIFAVWTAIIATGAGWTVHKVDQARYTALELAYSQASAKAIADAAAEQKRLDDIQAAAAATETANQAAMSTQSAAQVREVTRYVTVVHDCIPWGLVRVLSAAVQRTPASSLSLPHGVVDATCTSLSWPALAAIIVGDYGIANANAEQLNALIAAVRKK